MKDSNFPADLAIHASTRKSVKLAALRRTTTEDDAEGSRSPEEDENEDAEQDIGTYGIAGRTWEAAYAMRAYLTPPAPPPAPPSLIFDPPCPLFGDLGTAVSTSPAPSTPTSTSTSTSTVISLTPRKRTIIETGSGTGFLSLALAPHLTAEDSFILSDLDEVVPLMEKNLRTARERWAAAGRRVEAEVLVRPLPWGDAEALSKLEAEGWDADVVLASDLVYFPFLYPGLLRTLIGLTRRRAEKPATKVLFSYKIRSLVREQPFWSSFGRWFTFEAVLVASTPPKPTTPAAAPPPLEWTRFGTGDEDELFIFVCERRPETYEWTVPEDDEELMRGASGQAGADDQFERLLLGGIEWD